MTKSTIAIITDSTSDISREYLEQHHIFMIPLQVHTPKGQFLDGVDISPDEVYDGMPEVVPTTSQPAPDYVMNVFEQIKAEGYEEAIAVCISSGLSGTYDVLRLCANDVEGLKVHVVDSLRLSLALGFQVMHAVEMNESGRSAQEIVNALKDGWKKANGLFCMPTLNYLIKGGRIGLVAGTVGKILGLVPVITMNEDGKYITLAKTRSYAKAIEKIIETVSEIISGKLADVAILQGGAKEQAKQAFAAFSKLKGLRTLYTGQISPVLGVHTGPGLFGIAYRIIEDRA